VQHLSAQARLSFGFLPLDPLEQRRATALHGAGLSLGRVGVPAVPNERLGNEGERSLPKQFIEVDGVLIIRGPLGKADSRRGFD
jgi:hypothetical protein